MLFGKTYSVLGSFCLAVAVLALSLPSRADSRPLTSSSVHYLPVPDAAEWQRVHIGPDGAEIYLPDYSARIAVVDAVTHGLARTLAVPNDEYITGMGFTSTGRLIVVGEVEIFELDPLTGDVLQTTDAPWSWWGGPIVFNSDDSLGYIVGGDNIYLLQIDPLQLINPATGMAGTESGLATQNPQWADDWYRVWDILISPDDDRLYIVGDGMLKIISGLNSNADYSGLGLSVHTLGATAWNNIGDSVQIYLSHDGTWLADSYGDVYSTADMSLLGSFGFGPIQFFNPLMMALSDDETLMFSGGYAMNTNDVSQSGEYLLVGSMADISILDLDEDASNGLTGIKLPEANGWDTNGSYNQHRMQMTPDGSQLYIAAGSSGALVVQLERDASDFIVPNHGARGESITLTIAGNFAPTSTIRLANASTTLTQGLDIHGMPTGGLGLRFDLSDVPIGTYDLIVTPPSGSETVFAQSFFVEEPSAYATVDMIGDRAFFAVDSAKSKIVVQNYSNFDLEELIVGLRFGAGTRYRVSLPAMVEGGAEQVDTEYTIAQDGVPEYIWIYRLPAHKSYTFSVEIAGPAGVAPENWDIWTEASVGFVKESSVPATWGIFGDLCSFGDAVVTAIRKDTSRNGHDFSRTQINNSFSNVVTDTAVNFGVSKVTGMAVSAVATLLGGPVSWAVNIAMDLDACFGFFKKLFGFNSLFSTDPNDKLSSTGINGYVRGSERLRYQVVFENQADATAPAQTVVVTDQLDVTALDLSSFTLDASSHPAEMSVNLNTVTGVLEVRFDAINLPANVTAPEGEGWFEYSVDMKPGLASGTQIRNQASIVFDLNAPILTSEVVRTVDHEAPQGTVEALANTTVGTDVDVHWSAQEDGVGVWQYDVYVAVDRQEFTLWHAATSATSAHYQGNLDEHLAFYAVARDKLGNSDEAKTSADTETVLVEEGTILPDAGHSDAANVNVDAEQSVKPDAKDDDKDEGCGCTSSGQQPSLWVGLLVLSVLFRRSSPAKHVA